MSLVSIFAWTTSDPLLIRQGGSLVNSKLVKFEFSARRSKGNFQATLKDQRNFGACVS